MIEKIKALWGKVDERWFAVAAVLATYLIAKSSGSADLSLADILVIKIAYVATLLTTSIAFLYFLRGTHYDVMREIFHERNLSASVLVVGYLIAIALVVGS